MSSGGKVLVVFSSVQERGLARFLEGGGFPFRIGHLDRPELVLDAVGRIDPDLVIIYTQRGEAAAYPLCQRIREMANTFAGLIAVACPEAGEQECALAIDAGADALVVADDPAPVLVARVAGLLNSSKVAKEYLRRSRSLARASAEAADIIVQLEEADRRIREQNDQLRLRDAQIVRQQGEIQKHLDTLRRELQLAASLQISLMPSGRAFSEGTNLSLFDRYIPAADLGGDYYDYVRLPDGGLFICVADVTGHGVAPSLVTVQLRALARSHLQNGQALPAVMNDLNTFMYETFHQEYLMTMAGLIYRPGAAELEFVGAGHCPLIHYQKQTGECCERFSKGLPLGVMEDVDFELTTFPFAPGDRVLLYTDGITEAGNQDDEEFSPARVLDVMGSPHGQGAKLLEYLLQEVNAYTGGEPFHDDVTLVLVERHD